MSGKIPLPELMLLHHINSEQPLGNYHQEHKKAHQEHKKAHQEHNLFYMFKTFSEKI